MELKKNGMHLISEDEKKIREEQDSLMRTIKNKYFSLGRDIDKFVRLTAKLQTPEIIAKNSSSDKSREVGG